MSARFFTRVSWPIALASAAAITVLLGYWPARLWRTGWVDYLADDAFFYFVIARNIVRHGLSSFDGIVLTNGYQPVWQAVLVVQHALAPNALSAVVFVELALLLLAAVLTFRALPPGDAWIHPLAAALIVATIGYPLILDGMETSILFAAFALFVLALRTTHRTGEAWFATALSGALVTGCRLDAAFFVLAAIWFVPTRKRPALLAIGLIAILGLIYVVANKLVFDAWLPVSGSVKSLGGMQLNRMLIGQLAQSWNGAASPLFALSGFVRSLEGRVIALFVVTLGLLAVTPQRNGFAWRLGLGLAVGFVPFALRLAFFSSWQAWEWYCFPIFFFLVADVLLIAALVRAEVAGIGGWIVRAAPGGAVLVLLMTSSVLQMREAVLAGGALFIVWTMSPLYRGGIAVAQGASATVGLCLLIAAAWPVTRKAPSYNAVIGHYSPVLAKHVTDAIGVQRVAMADRAGAFAYFYDGSVSQLEGLVNDQRYLRALERHEPIEPLLCSRGVRYLASYQVDLGNYDTFTVHPFRSYLTSFDGPAIKVARSDEVAKITDAESYGVVYKDSIIYLWRLAGCGS